MITHVYLVVWVLVAGNAPDLRSNLEMSSIDACWDAAREFVAQPLPQAVDANGLGATCYVMMDGEGP